MQWDINTTGKRVGYFSTLRVIIIGSGTPRRAFNDVPTVTGRGSFQTGLLRDGNGV